MEDFGDYNVYLRAFGETSAAEGAVPYSYNSGSTFDPPPTQGGPAHGFPVGQDYYSQQYMYNQAYPEDVFNALPQFRRQDFSDISQNDLSKIFDLEDSYPSWSQDTSAPLSKDDIWKIFDELRLRFGFQRDSCSNMYDHFMVQLDSRTSRFPASEALISLHSDYIGGPDSNYRKWYFAAFLDLDEEVGLEGNNVRSETETVAKFTEDQVGLANRETTKFHLSSAIYRWKKKMAAFGPKDMVYQLALYLLIWGEANQVRYLPECICFIYKCASDYMFAEPEEGAEKPPDLPEFDFLDRVITPIYNYIRDQQFEKIDGNYFRRELDHDKIIGYDDINQLFWYPEGIARLITTDGIKLKDVHMTKRYSKLGRVDWNKACYKTYYESRSWFHLATNFSRIWVIHLSVFWYCTSFNSSSLYTPNFKQLLNNPPTPQSTWSVTSLAGAISCSVYLLAVCGELAFVPKIWPGRERCRFKLILGIAGLLLNAGPSVYVFVIIPRNVYSQSAYIVSIVQFAISVVTVIFLSFQPLGGLFGSYLRKSKKFVSSQTFTASFPKLKSNSKTCSYMLWSSVFIAKFLESYVFLTLSLKDPIRNLTVMSMDRCSGDILLGKLFCQNQAKFTLVLMYLTDLVLFFLDTYLWYIICNCIFSVFLSFSSGISILSPWRNIFTRLPQRVRVKILSSGLSEGRYKTKFLVSQIWNSIVISMFQGHILSKEHAAKLLYQQVTAEYDGSMSILEPGFFVNQDDGTTKLSNYFPSGSEAERRLSFFAHSLSMRIPDPSPMESMPTFTVLVPHYSEKILLSLKDVIREDRSSKISLLEYLRKVYDFEWRNFVEDSKELGNLEVDDAKVSKNSESPTPYVFEKGNEAQMSANHLNHGETLRLKARASEIPYYYVGFKDSSPKKTLRTRVWASLRTQTLFRTVAGFYNYFDAIKLLYRTENLDLFDNQYEGLESEQILDYVAKRKFNFIISMQRYEKFSNEEQEAVKLLIAKYPFIKIVVLQEEPPKNEDDDPTYYSALLGVTQEASATSPTGDTCKLSVIYRVRLSGNPIIGDGKSDNQNHAIIFYRGEYIQVIDANQDMYFEECLKIRSVLAEFEELTSSKTEFVYDAAYLYPDSDPVAVVGAREHIFTEAIGSLGDVAAGKEKTFGTLFARTLAEIGGKLHYGHPDFLNAIFMTTRGGISKAQKGIHLNEDIYAGMMAVCRGGRIKHSDFFQCGKGRDLGFGSILNFTSKIGGGMGEQMLSREYFYLGTQLPLHRFLSFYYAHAGFHLNNLFIILSVQLFMMVLINLGSLNHEVVKCIYDKNVPFSDLQHPIGCYNLQPVLDWVTRFVISICICFFISFAPLIVQEFTERGLGRAIYRFLCHLFSLSPVFEVFVCQIYSNSLKSDLTFGGARYVATGRTLATSRLQFTELYSRYAGSSIYSGTRLFLILLFASISMWQVALLWFWLTVVALCFSPFIFNPHNFSMFDYFLDYRNFIRWLTRGNSKFHQESWIAFTRASRSKFTGLKKKTWKDENRLPVIHRAAFANSFFSEICLPLGQAMCSFIAYMFINSQNGVKNPVPLHAMIRMVLLVMLPIMANAIVLMLMFPISCIGGPVLRLCCARVGNVFAGIAHGFGILIHILMFEVTCFLEGWEISRALVAFICTIFIQRVLFQVVKVCLLTRELRADYANRAWWSGKWLRRGAGTLPMTQPVREFIVKTVEMSLFAADFTIGHFLFFCLTPIVFIPYIDRAHSCVLFWLAPKVQYTRGIISSKERDTRRRRVLRYCVFYCFMAINFAFLLAVPIVAGKFVNDMRDMVPEIVATVIQPMKQDNNDTGSNAPLSIVTAKPVFTQYKTYPY